MTRAIKTIKVEKYKPIEKKVHWHAFEFERTAIFYYIIEGINEVLKAYRTSQEPGVLKLKEPALDEITHALVGRYNLNFTRQDISSLWFLCKQEASLLNITDQACALFTPSEVFNIPLLSVATSFVAEDISKNASKGSTSDERTALPSVPTALLLALGIGLCEALAMYLGSGLFLNMMGISTVGGHENYGIRDEFH
ncbi:uncharacterized protein LOC114311547 [Camellia sinensis]|uniref:uncharacterized protein LOC114311547 n=1 Tax=Camellia sinensis TaxID=4442 RepID=UPI001035CF4D|nr:uncharacterized protein LOC114311547 [Camellia sinensis]